MNATLRDIAEKLMLAIHAAIDAEIPIKNVRDKAYDEYRKADDEYTKSRRNIAELCAALDGVNSPPAVYPLPHAWGRDGGKASPAYGVVRERCLELRRIAQRNRKLEEEQQGILAETPPGRQRDLVFVAPEEVM